MGPRRRRGYPTTGGSGASSTGGGVGAVHPRYGCNRQGPRQAESSKVVTDSRASSPANPRCGIRQLIGRHLCRIQIPPSANPDGDLRAGTTHSRLSVSTQRCSTFRRSDTPRRTRETPMMQAPPPRGQRPEDRAQRPAPRWHQRRRRRSTAQTRPFFPMAAAGPFQAAYPSPHCADRGRTHRDGDRLRPGSDRSATNKRCVRPRPPPRPSRRQRPPRLLRGVSTRRSRSSESATQ